MGFKRRLSDFEDSRNFFEWFETRNPFTYEDTNLHYLSTGAVSIIGKDMVNCENAETVGLSIQQSLANVNFTDATIKRKDQLRSLESLTKRIKIDDKNSIFLISTRLFTRLAAIAQREEDVEQYFEFALTLRPQALLKNDLMCKPDKSSLRKILLTDHRMCLEDDVNGVYHVLDGGALLYREHWIKGTRIKEVILAYVTYVRKKLWKLFHCV